ncbi:exopolysaccharide biosynthesis polyprenyl glycosylphosphotransferase [Tenacibaculum sp. UWU-22]|uniref:exopolysaccharide biosynthesis polyprenyl glycosylphosphotransferase n=1 Tax=Tenacibaculum sp. UWU-22 TaxID=3234187 RepID=UPI0034DAE242
MNNKRYSHLIRPLSVLIDLICINSVIFFIADKEYLDVRFLIYINLFWVISSFLIGFYNSYRGSKYFRLFTLLVTQFAVFFFGFFAYFTLFREGVVVNNQTLVFAIIFLVVTIVKLLFLYALEKYRSSGKNFRKVVVLGSDASTQNLIELFTIKKEFGYVFEGFFSDKISRDKNYKGIINDCFNYVLTHKIDEIYCSLSELSKKELKHITIFASQHSIVLKLIPNPNHIYSKDTTIEYYNSSLLLLKVKPLPFESKYNHFVKRLFDVFFSIFVLFFILSWVVPILWIFIKLESKGPVLFKQIREGINGKPFMCYKFRSMRLDAASNKNHTKKNDDRVTKVGAFLRRTSLDELPQFYNVLKGDMSVVGPRPHVKSFSLMYQKTVDNYLERHIIKPGITGLAQVNGYRGEVKCKADIKNRIRLDIFYIENWSIFLDIKIIIQTIVNIIKGDEKAY